jgi:SAM-dependent methyltransferase
VRAGVPNRRQEAYGERGLSPVDRLGVALSVRRVRRAGSFAPPPRVLDLGCGYDATMLRELSPRIASGIGVDLRVSDDARADARLSFIEAPIEEALPGFEDASVDLILLISVLEHLAEPERALSGCRRVLAPGGTLMVNVPTWLGKRFLEASAFRLGLSPACEMDDHKMYYGRRDLWPLLVRAGFRPSRIRTAYHKGGLNLFATAAAE